MSNGKNLSNEKKEGFKKPLDTKPPSIITEKPAIENSNNITEEKEVINQEKFEDQIKKDISPVNKSKPNDKKYIIDILSLLTNIVLALFTYLLFNKTTEANNTSQEALKESKRANDISKGALDRAIDESNNSKIREKTIDSLDSIDRAFYYEENAKRNYLQNKQIETQINNLKSSQEHFELNSRPYLQVNKIKFTQFKPNLPLKIRYEIVNLGSHSAKIINGKYGYFIGTKVKVYPFRELPNVKPDPLFNNQYVMWGYPSVHYIDGVDIMATELINKITSEDLKVTVFGEYSYLNELTGKIRIYNFSIWLRPNEEFFFVKNENRDSVISNTKVLN